jgi:hypothetical protein
MGFTKEHPVAQAQAAGVIFGEAEQSGADPAVLGRWQDSHVASSR